MRKADYAAQGRMISVASENFKFTTVQTCFNLFELSRNLFGCPKVFKFKVLLVDLV